MKNGIIIALILSAILVAIVIKVFNIGISIDQKPKEDTPKADKETLAAPAEKTETEKPKVEEKKIEVKKEEVKIDNSSKVKELEIQLLKKKASFLDLRKKKNELEAVLNLFNKKPMEDISAIPELQTQAASLHGRIVPVVERVGLANKAFIDAKKELESASKMDTGFKSAGERIGWYLKGETQKMMRRGAVPKYLKGKVIYVYRGEVEAKERMKRAKESFEECKNNLEKAKVESQKLDDEYKAIKEQYIARIKKDIEQIKEQMSRLKDEGDKLKEEIKKIQD
jgi:chromosome segregation ATPase